MKIRYGHVSNSSSSSFTIAYKKIPEFDTETLERYPVLKAVGKLINNLFGRERPITTIEALDERLIAREGYGDINTVEKILEDCPYDADEYHKSKKALEDGFEIIEVEIENYDTDRIELMSSIADGENVIMIAFNG